MTRTKIAALALALVVVACGGDESADSTASEVTSEVTSDAASAAGEATDTTGSDAADATSGEAGGEASGEATAAAGGSCDVESLPLTEAGTLTVATGEPVFKPWMVDDDPTNQQGFESALVYAVAEQLGFPEDQVTWVRTGFDEAVGPGEKPYDFNVQQYSITPERDEVVDFSTGYYTVEQALVAAEDSPVADAAGIEDLRSARLGAAIGTTSLDYIEEVIQPETEAQVFDDNAAAKAAFDAGQVDGLVFDLPTAYFVTAVEITDASIVGVLEAGEGAEELGFLFEDGSPLVPCVDQALEALREDGTLDALEEEWLNQAGDIPTLTR